MSRPRGRWLAALPVALASGTFLLWSCSDPAGLRWAPGFFAVTPVVTSAAGIVPVARARFVLLHLPDEAPVQDTLINLPADADSVDLTLSVPMAEDADSFALHLALVGPTGDTVFRGGPVTVRPARAGPVPMVILPLVYVGIGADAAGVEIVTGPATLVANQQGGFTAVARDAQGTAIPGTPVAWSTLDPGLVTVPDRGTGVVQANGQRGTARVVATLLTGPADTATVGITLPPATIVADSGGGQTGPAAALLPARIVTRVLASDGLPVAGVPVQFSANLGGTVAPASAVTDANGRAGTAWTLGNVAGAQLATATTAALPGQSATFPATAIASGPGLVTIAGGNLQSALVSTAVAVSPTVRVTDLQENPLAGVTVTFAVAGGGGAVTGATPVTDANGLASAGSWTLGPVAALNTLTATVTGLTPVAFVALGTAQGGATTMTVNAGDGQSAPA
ncbi:MAG TPA: hypothetical protein VFH97_07520, partial [Gemmatimonadales bacterium]|nr:hypothetical protein [Gemmatimonadales bacterium]